MTCFRCLVILICINVHFTDALRVALCFIGLTRSLQFTINNVRSNILDPLTEMDIDYQVFVHTYQLSHLTNLRTGESDVLLQWQKYKLLHPSASIVEDALDTDAKLFSGQDGLSEYMRFNGHSLWTDLDRDAENTTVKNFIKQLWSARQCTTLWQKARHAFDVVIYLRSDSWFFTPLNASTFTEMEQDKLYLPDWADHFGLHDRFAFGSPSVMQQYGLRFDNLKEFCLAHSIHSEAFLAWIVAYHKINLKRIELFFENVRANGIMNACCHLDMKPACLPLDTDCVGRKRMHFRFDHDFANFDAPFIVARDNELER